MKTYPDDFDRADGLLGSPWVSNPASAWGVRGGVAQILTTTTSGFAGYNQPLDTLDQIVRATPITVTGNFGLFARANSTLSTYYALRRASSTTITLGRVIASTHTPVASVTYTLVMGQPLELRVYGRKLEAWANGVKILEFVDDSADAITDGYIGGMRSWASASGTQFDNFLATDYVAAADTTGPTAPSVSLTSLTSSLIKVAWSAATDASGVGSYDVIYAIDGRSPITHFINDPAVRFDELGLTSDVAGKTVSVTVRAYDTAENAGAISNAVGGTIPGGTDTGGGTPTTPPTSGAGQKMSVKRSGVELIQTNSNVRTFGNDEEVGYFYGGRSLSVLENNVERTFQLPDARPSFSKWVGKTLCAYGDSSGVLQTTAGVDYTVSETWPRLVGAGFEGTNPDPSPYPNGLGTTVSNRHAGSLTAQDVANRMLIAGGTYEWKPKSFDLVSVFVGGNDVGILHNSAAGRLGYKNSLSAILGILRHTSRVSASVNSGSWSANPTQYSGNTHLTTTPGDTTAISFTGTDATLMLHAMTSGGGSSFTYSIDGAAAKSGTTKGQGAPSLVGGSYVPFPIHLRGLSSGSHTVTITHTGSAGDTLIVDSVLVWGASEADMPFVLMVPPGHSTTAGWNNYPTPKPTNTDADEFRILFNQAIDQFSFAKNIGRMLADAIDVRFPSTDYSIRINDGLHPNKQGHRIIAAMIMEMLRQYNPTR